MKIQGLCVLVGTCAPLITTGLATARFTGLTVESKPNDFGLFVCNVYARFDNPGHDRMQSVLGTPHSPMNISVIGGTFYQHFAGTDRPPNPALFAVFPSLRYDTFVTIGVKSFNPNDPGNPEGAPDDNMQFSPQWPGFGPSSLQGNNLGWIITPLDRQGDPFNPAYNGDGRVLIGQFATANGSGFVGTMLLSYLNNDVFMQTTETFLHVPGPGAAPALGALSLLLGTRRRRAGAPGHGAQRPPLAPAPFKRASCGSGSRSG